MQGDLAIIASITSNPHNIHNHHIYSQNSSAAADFLVSSKPVQHALKHWLEQLSSHDPLRILELGSSSRPDRWTFISSLPTTRKWQVTLSDLAITALPSTASLPNTPDFFFSNKQIDLLTDSFPTTQKYDVVLATYVFDAIWFPQDMYVNQMHYPGGLISKVQQAFSTCLDSQGIFISIDRTSTRFVPEYDLSGPARFKTENYQLAQSDLNKIGFQTQLLNLNQFLSSANVQVPLDLSDHQVLIVRQ